MTNPFKSVGHFFATVFTKLKADEPKVEAGIQKVENTASTVETVTAAVPVYGPMALTVEKAAYAVLGEIAAVMHAGDSAASAKLQDSGLDINVIQTVEALLADVKQYAALIKK